MARSSDSSRHTITKSPEASHASAHNPDTGDGAGEYEQASNMKRTVEGEGNHKGTRVLLRM